LGSSGNPKWSTEQSRGEKKPYFTTFDTKRERERGREGGEVLLLQRSQRSFVEALSLSLSLSHSLSLILSLSPS